MAANRNFETFVFGDNVLELAGGLIPEVADHFGITLDTPDTEKLGQLVGLLGKNKVLRDNDEVQAVSLTEAASYVERSGVQEALNRPLWTPDGAKASDVDRVLLTGAVANWQDRGAELLVKRMVNGGSRANVYVVTGNRVMDTVSDQKNANVQAFMTNYSAAPTESQYAERFVAPLLVEAGYAVYVGKYDTDNGDELASTFVNQESDLFDDTVQMSFARVANAGIQLAVQFRAAARANTPDYDRPDFPQIFIETDSFPIARTPEEVANPREFQSPFTALRQVALTAKLLQQTFETE